jgi:hypothetical protein
MADFFHRHVRPVRVVVSQPLDRERSTLAIRFSGRFKFLRVDGATLTDAPAEEIVPALSFA